MSNYEYEDEDDDFTNDSSNDLVKQLRKASKQKDKELQELRSQFENLSKGQRERAIKDVLATRGVNSKIASFIPQDIDPTEESLSKWLDDYADVFGYESGQTQASPSPKRGKSQGEGARSCARITAAAARLTASARNTPARSQIGSARNTEPRPSKARAPRH